MRKVNTILSTDNMSEQKLHPSVVKLLEANSEPQASTVTVRLDKDVNAGLDAARDALGGKKSKQDIVNDLLRVALFSDALSGAVLAQEAA